ncbi:cysteine desulfurase [Agrobacterium rhizogenes]|nr:cysteine desulfurase [Rhizobium rhizogenes]
MNAMTPWWHSLAANPHSPHARGLKAHAAVDTARAQLADLVFADPQEITFVSGATEANNLAILGTARAALLKSDSRRHIVVSAIEHKSVIDTARSLENQGFQISLAPVARSGVIDLDALKALCTPATLLVSVMAVNNEVGSIQPVQDIVSIARQVGALVHVDAAQALGKIPIDVRDVDYASFSSHKVYGPIGIGALFVSAAAEYRPSPLLYGGGQELGLRPGTVPVPLAVGFGAAAALAGTRLAQDRAHSLTLSRLFLQALSLSQLQYTENIAEDIRVPGSLSLRFPGIDAMSVIIKMGDVLSISEGSACSSGQIVQSHVLKAMGFTVSEAQETLRLYFSRYNTEREIADAVSILATALRD